MKRSDQSEHVLKRTLQTLGRGKRDTPWGEHILCFHKDADCEKSKTPTFAIRIQAFEENVVLRKVKEAMKIRDRQP